MDTKLTIADISKLIQLLSVYLSKILKETNGYSIIKFFNKIKIDKAKDLNRK